MPVPDIIIPLTADPNGPTAHVWIEAVEVTRQGQDITPGLSDKWKLALPLRASLGMGSELMRDANGGEISIPSPLISPALDVARLVHHPEVVDLLTRLRDVTLRIVTGDLQPAQPELIQEPTP